ncbi:MAG: hypothetical protein BRD49_04535 [Bacteroidetes bacterium SW_10_40_5]|nr:MAG: hypothetical protein BRD49_04535 [Bacteroidetes bacterium SW_10_40_5]
MLRYLIKTEIPNSICCMPEQSMYHPYQPPRCFQNKYFNTIFTNLWRDAWLQTSYVRKRIETPDQDFLDLDLASAGSNKALLLVHGLEGDAYAPYVKGMVKAAKQAGWDAVSLNLRGCSGTINWQPNIYHSGRSEDLHNAILHLLEQEAYQYLAIIGFSLGGNLTLKYTGERAERLDERIKAVTAVSVPFDLENVALNMDQISNVLFRYRFLTEVL